MSRDMMFIESPRLYFRAVLPSDAAGNYLRWMNDPEVTRYLEVRYKPNSIENIKDYIERMRTSRDDVFCAIILKDGDRHIGNMHLGPIDWIHRRADVAAFIGEKDCWGSGYITEALRLMFRHAFHNLNLNKVTGGVYDDNIRSVRAALKSGLREEGRRKQHYFLDGRYLDAVILGILREDFIRQEMPVEAVVEQEPVTI